MATLTDEMVAMFVGDGSDSGGGSGNGNSSGPSWGSGWGSGIGPGNDSGGGGGDGCGWGYGSGEGSGNGSGGGSGYGWGYGYGSGEGSGCGIKQINGHRLYNIDGMMTAINHIRGNVAKGGILEYNFRLRPCFIVKQDGVFAHGDTLREAMSALREKLYEDKPEEERISDFVAAHDANTKYDTADLYEWHHHLTGSCKAGRDAWIANNGIEISKPLTPIEFCELCKDAYGGEIIRKVLEEYERIGQKFGS